MAVAGVPLVAASAAFAIPNKYDFYTGTTPEDWATATAWSDGVPGAEDTARVISSADLTLDTAAAVNSLTYGYGPNVNATLTINTGGSLVSGNDIIFGGDGSAANAVGVNVTVNQNDGSIAIPANHILWIGVGANATYNMAGGSITVGYPGRSQLSNLGISIGNGAGAQLPTVAFNMTGGTINCDSVFNLARSGSTASLNMSGGTINLGDEAWIGQVGTTGGQGTIVQTGGTINTGFNQYGPNAYSDFLLGIGNVGKAANYTLSGSGALNIFRNLDVGGGHSWVGNQGGEGNFVMNGGSVSMGDARQVSGSNLYIGWAPGALTSKGSVTVNSGTMTFNLPNSAIVVGSYDTNTGTLPTDQTGTMTIAGGTVTNAKGMVEIGRAGATGTLNLSSGQLTADSLVWLNPAGNTNVRQFNFTGGTLDLNSANSDYAITNAGGTFRPGGTATKTFTTTGADGSYVQSSGSTSIDLASNADYDAIDVSAGGVGAVNLTGGTVNVNATGTYAPAFGSAFPVLTGKSIGDSAVWNLPTLPAGDTWDRRSSVDGSGNQVESLAVIRASSSTLSAGSSWNTGTWSAGTPNAADASAKLAGAGGTVTIDAPTTVGYLQLDGTGSWTVDGTNTLSFNASSGPAGIMAFGGSHTISAPVAFNSNAVIGTQLKSTNVTLSGDVAGSGTVEKTGPGSVTLSSVTSPFTGTWSISGGSLNVDSDANLGAAGANLAFANSTLNSTGAWNSSRNIALNSTGATLNLGGDSTLSGTISGPGGITKTDVNALILSGANSYTGATNVNAGTLRQGVANSVPSSSAVNLASGTTLDLNSQVASVGSLTGAGNVTNNTAGLTVGNDNTNTLYTGIVSGGGSFTKTGTGTLTFDRPASASPTVDVVPIDGPITVNGGTLAFNNLNLDTYDLPSSDITVNAGANLSLNSSGANGVAGGVFYGAIHGAGTLTIGPTYLITLTTPSDYTGGTIITGGATAQITDMGALGADGTPIHAIGTNTRDNLSYTGGIIFGIGDGVNPASGTFNHPLSLDGYKYFALSTNDSVTTITMAQPITGGGAVNWRGGGTFILNAVNTFQGGSQEDAGVKLILGVDNALPDQGIAVNGTLDLNGHNQALGFLVSGGTPVIHLNNGNLTINANIDPTYGGGWTGTMDGNGSLTLTGGGTQLIGLAPTTPAASYTGGTFIHQGALQINGNIGGLPAGQPVQVDAGGELIFATSAAGSNLAAGSTVNFTGNISGAGEVEIASTSTDGFSMSGTNTYTGGTRLSDGYLVVNDNANLGAPTTPITYWWNGSNPGPVLKFGAADVNLTRDIIIQHSPAFVDTNGFNATVQNIDGNLNPVTGGPANFTKLGGAGTLTANHVRLNALAINVGTIKIASNTGDNSVSNVRSLAINPGAFFDINNNKMVVGGNNTGTWDGTNSVYTGITGMVATARNGGTWNGTTGITSSAVTPGSNLYSVGVVAAADKFGLTGSQTAVWNGQTVGVGDTLVMYTYGGDANLDGKINIDDYGRIDGNVGQSGTVFGWYNGDFNYDGKINIDDYGIIDGNIGQQGAPLSIASALSSSAEGGVSAVPEPASIGLIGLGAMSLLGARRRRRRA